MSSLHFIESLFEYLKVFCVLSLSSEESTRLHLRGYAPDRKILETVSHGP